MSRPIYLDYAATTPVDPRVAERMRTYLTPDGDFGNPASTQHRFGRAARDAVEQAREHVARLINAAPREIVWTSGATESNNLAIKGAALSNQQTGHIVTCKTEHRAVLDPCKRLERDGIAVTYLAPESDGLLNLGKLERALRADTILVSIMHVNNETGVVQDLPAIGEVTRRHNLLFHVDAAQGAGKLSIDVKTCNVDLLSVTAHKIYGPKGIGALYVRHAPNVRLDALIHGGGHERGLRAGTLPTHQIVGMGEAFRLGGQQMVREDRRIRALRNRLWHGLGQLDNVRVNGNLERSVAGMLNVSFAGIVADDLLLALPDIALSTGSACSSFEQQPSHVLRALGLSDELIDSSVRFSVGRFTTADDVDRTVEATVHAVTALREHSGIS